MSGSQVEINNFKDAFERGEDPLADVNDASDINSVAGLANRNLFTYNITLTFSNVPTSIHEEFQRNCVSLHKRLCVSDFIIMVIIHIFRCFEAVPSRTS